MFALKSNLTIFAFIFTHKYAQFLLKIRKTTFLKHIPLLGVFLQVTKLCYNARQMQLNILMNTFVCQVCISVTSQIANGWLFTSRDLQSREALLLYLLFEADDFIMIFHQEFLYFLIETMISSIPLKSQNKC